MSEPRLHFEASHSFEEGATFAVEHFKARYSYDAPDGRYLTVSVAEEQAVDSYNQSFTCTMHLTEAQAAQLRDWLNKHFPK